MSESGDRPGGSGHEDPTFGAFDSTRDPWARPPESPEADETVMVPRDGSPPGGADHQPDSGPPVYEPPKYEPPKYEPPKYEPPNYGATAYEPPTYGQQSYGQQGYGQQGYGQPSYEPPSYAPPSYQQPSVEPPPVYPPPATEPSPYSDPNQIAGGYAPPYGQQGYGATDPSQGYGQPAYPQNYGYGAPAYPAPGAYGYTGQSNSGKATAVMVLGIASLVTVWCYGLGIVPAIVALALGGSAKREIEGSGGAVGGAGMVSAGKVMSWISLALAVVFIVIIVLVIAFVPDTTTTYDGS